MIETGVKLGEEAVTAVAPDLGKALVANLPEIFGGGGKLDKALFDKALELAPNNFVKEQLVGMRDAATTLRQARLSNMRPIHGELSDPTRANFVSADGTTGSAFVHSSRLFSKSFSEGDRVPTQLISANLFNTVPPSMGRQLTFSSDMFADPTIFKRTVEKLNAPYLQSLKGTPLFELRRDIVEGRPVQAIVSKDAGAPISKTFDGTWARCPELIKQTESSSNLRSALHKTLIDREVIGDTDGNIGNFTLSQSGGKPSIGNIDFEYSFRAGSQPLLRKIFIDPALVGQKLEPSTASHIGQFVDAYSTSPGRQLLEDLGMHPAKIDGVLNRAQWFADNKTLPVLTDSK